MTTIADLVLEFNTIFAILDRNGMVESFDSFQIKNHEQIFRT